MLMPDALECFCHLCLLLWIFNISLCSQFAMAKYWHCLHCCLPPVMSSLPVDCKFRINFYLLLLSVSQLTAKLPTLLFDIAEAMPTCWLLLYFYYAGASCTLYVTAPLTSSVTESWLLALDCCIHEHCHWLFAVLSQYFHCNFLMLLSIIAGWLLCFHFFLHCMDSL